MRTGLFGFTKGMDNFYFAFSFCDSEPKNTPNIVVVEIGTLAGGLCNNYSLKWEQKTQSNK